MAVILTRPEDVEAIVADASARGVPVYSISTPPPADKSMFCRALHEVLNVDYPLVHPKWEGTQDSLCNTIDALGVPEALLLWRGASNMAQHSPRDYWVAFGVLKDVVECLGTQHQGTSSRPPTTFRALVVLDE